MFFKGDKKQLRDGEVSRRMQSDFFFILCSKTPYPINQEKKENSVFQFLTSVEGDTVN